MATSTETSGVQTANKLAVRPACPEDLGAFLELVRMCVNERGWRFDEDEARWLFAGIARADPAIHLLLDDLEPVGFTTVRTFCTPLTRIPGMHQEVLFVRADKRSRAAEMMLHRMTLEVFKALPAHSEISLIVNAEPHAAEVIEDLRRFGLQETQLRMNGMRAASEQTDKSSGEAEQATVH